MRGGPEALDDLVDLGHAGVALPLDGSQFGLQTLAPPFVQLQIPDVRHGPPSAVAWYRGVRGGGLATWAHELLLRRLALLGIHLTVT